MANLKAALDKIRNRSTAATGPSNQQQQLTDQAVQKTAGARQSAGPAVSSMGQQRAQAANQTNLQQGQVQANKQATQVSLASDQQEQQRQQNLASQQSSTDNTLANIQTQQNLNVMQDQTSRQIGADTRQSQEEMQTKEMVNSYQNALSKLTSQSGLDQSQLFRNFQQSNKELEDRQDAAQLEQLAHVMSFQDQEYLETLKQIGAERDLRDQLQFERESAEIIMGDQLDSVLRQNKFTVDMAQDEADFAKELARMDSVTALEIIKAASKQSSTEAIFQGGAKVATTDKFQDLFKDDEQPVMPTEIIGGS